MNKADKIAKQVNKLSGIDVFENTRKRENIEARSLLNTVLYKYKKMSLSQIKDFYIQNGKSSHHTTVLHSLRNFDIFKNYNTELMEWLTCITSDMTKINNEAKRELIKIKINFISNKDVDEIALLVNAMAKKELETTD
jgi:hypothetical protein